MHTTLRSALLSLHRALIESERRAYEKTHGRTASGDFLKALVHEPSLAWLAPLTSLIARLDELGDDNSSGAQRRTLRARLRVMLAGRSDAEFAAKYAERMEASTDVAFAHAAALHALAS